MKLEKITLRALSFLVLVWLGYSNLLAQAGNCLGGTCTATGVIYSTLQTTTSNTFVAAPICVYAGSEYLTFSVTSGQTYEWSLCSTDGASTSLFDGQMTLINNSNSAVLCYSDDICGLMPKILWVATFTGTVRIQVNEYSCITSAVCSNIVWRCVTCAGNYNPCTTIPTISNCGVPTTFSQTGTSGLYDNVSCGYSTPGREVIYQFTAPVTGVYNLLVTAYTSTSGFSDFFWKPASGGCNNTGWNCITDLNGTGNFPGLVPMNFTAGTTYYIMADPEHTGNTNITFSLTCPAAPNPCTTVPTIANCGVSTTANFPAFSGAWNVTDCGFNTPGLERMFLFTAPLTGTYSIQVTSTTGGFVDYFWKLASLTCDNTNWNCIGDVISPGTYPGITAMNFIAGTTYRILLDPESTTAGSQTFQIICPTPAAPTTPTVSANPICVGGSVTLTANNVVGTPYWYTSSCGGTQVGTGNTLTVTPGTTTSYFLRNYNGYYFSTNCATVSITVEQPIGNNVIGTNQTVCANLFPSMLTGTLPTGGNGGYNYQWESSTALPAWSTMPGEINPDHSPFLLSQNTYYRRITTAGLCSPSTSNVISVTSVPTVTPAVSISTSSNTLCAGNTITFTATPTNSGPAPVYQWYLNFSPVGGNSSTYTSNSFANGDQITLDMTSNAQCASPAQVGANTVTLQVFPIPAQPTIQSNAPICQGNALTFSSNIVPGALYTWTGPGGFTGANPNEAINSAQVGNSGVYTLTHSVNGCTSPQETATLVVEPTLSPISISASQTLCQGTTAAALSASVPTGGTGIYVYQWESSTDNSSWNIVSSGTTSTTAPGVLNQSTYYRATVSAGVCPVSVSNSVIIVIEPPLSQNTITPSQTLCTGSAAQILTGSTPLGGNTQYQYQWQSSPTGSTWTNLPGQTTLNFNPGTPTLSGLYRRLVTAGVCPVSTSNSVQIQLDPVITNNTIGSAQTICPGFSPSAFTGSLPAGGLGTYTYLWESSTNNSTWVGIPSGTTLSYTEGNVTLSAYYRRQVNSGACQLTSGTVLLTVIPVITNNTVTPSQTLCAGGSFAPLTGSLPGGGSGSFSYSWESSNNNSSWTLMTGVTTQDFSHGPAVTSVFYRRQITSGSCPGTPSASVSLIVEQLLGSNSISANQTICNPLNAAPLAGTLPSGGSQVYLYQWQTSADNLSWSNFSGETQQSLSLTGPSSNTYYRRVVQAGLCPSITSSVVSIQATPQITGNAIGVSQTICIGGIPTPLTGTLPGGGTGSYVYQWETSLDNSTWAIVSGATNASLSPGNVFQNTYFRRGISSGVCLSVSPVISVQGDQTSGNNFIGSSQTICTGNTPAPFTGSLPTGGTGVFTYQWQSSANSSTWADIAGATNQNYACPPLILTRYFRRQVASGGCAPINSNIFSVLVVPVPTANLSGTTLLCPGNATQLSLSLSGQAPWDFTWTDGTTPVTVTGYTATSYLINTTPAATTTFSVTSVFSVCAGTPGSQAVVSITPVPTATLSGSQTICNGQQTNLTVNFTGLAPWNFTWTDGTTSTNVNGVTANPYLIPISPGAPRTYTLTAMSNACAGLVSGTANVMTYAPPGAHLSSSQTICQGVGTNLSITLNGIAPWDIVYTDGTNSYTVNGIASTLYTIPINPAFNTTYSMISVTNGCVGVVAGVADIAVRPAPSASISGNHNICLGDSARLTVNLSGVAPWNISYSDGTTTTLVTGILTSPYTFSVTPGSSRNYTLNNVFSTCFGSISGTATVTVNTPPVGFMTGNATICQGASTPIQIGLSGTSPWTVTYSMGTTAVTVSNILTSPYSFTVTPGQTTVYSLISVQSACPGTAAGNATVVVNPIPTATMSGTVPYCSGGTAQLSIQLTGVAPFSVTYNNGGPPLVVSGITASPYVFTVTPVAASTYTVTNVTGTCTGISSGSVAVVPEGPPNAVLSGTQTTCISVGAILTVNFTGTGPFSLVYTDGTANYTLNNITANPYSWTVNPGGSQKTYQLISVTGACAGTVSGTAVVDVQPRPVAVLSAPLGVCTGSTALLTAQLTGTGPWNLTYTDGTSIYTENGIAGSPYSWSITPLATATWSLVSVQDANCIGNVLANPAVINVSPAPAFTFSGNATICGGSSTALSLNVAGNPPFNFVYSDGTTNFTQTGISGDSVFWVSPADTTIYRIVGVSSLGCSATSLDSVIVNVIPAPSSAWVGADQTICSLNASLVANNPTSGSGQWSVVTGSGTIANPSAFSTSISGMSVGLNIVQWTVSNGPCVSAAQMNLFVSTPPTNADAGPNQNICGTSTVMAANTPINGTGTWTIVSGSGTIQDVFNPNTAVTGISVGQLVLMWTITSGSCVSNATVTINAAPSAPVANAGNDQNICTGTALLSALPGTASGQWSLVSGNPVTITNPNAAQTTVSGLILGSYQFVWTTAASGCSNTDTMVIQVIPTPVANFSFIQFGFDADFTDLSQGGITAWNWAFGDGQTSNQQNPQHTYAQAGNYNVRLVVTNACRTDTIFRNLRIFGVGVDNEAMKGSGMSLYPNPAEDGYFNLKMWGLDGSASEVQINILSVTGVEVYSVVFPVGDQTDLDYRVSPDRLLARGTYWIEVSYGKYKFRRQQVIR